MATYSPFIFSHETEIVWYISQAEREGLRYLRETLLPVGQFNQIHRMSVTDGLVMAYAKMDPANWPANRQPSQRVWWLEFIPGYLDGVSEFTPNNGHAVDPMSIQPGIAATDPVPKVASQAAIDMVTRLAPSVIAHWENYRRQYTGWVVPRPTTPTNPPPQKYGTPVRDK